MDQRARFIVVTIVAYLAVAYAAPSIDTQPICSSGRLDLVLVVDVSGSVEHKYQVNREAASEIAHAMPIGWDKVNIAVIQYSRQAIMKLQFSMSQTAELINETISNLEWTGGVAYGAEAMDLAMIQFRRARSDSDRIIILFSDGNSLNPWTEVQATAERLRYSNARIFAVSLGGTTYEPELKAYIGNSNGSIVKTREELQALKKELLGYTVPACRSRPSLSSKVESKNVDESDDKESQDKAPRVDDNDHTMAPHGKVTAHGKRRTHGKHGGHTSTSSPVSKRTGATFMPFTKRSTTKTTKTTRKTTTARRTTLTPTPTATDTPSATPMDGTEVTEGTAGGDEPTTPKSTKRTTPRGRTTTTDFFDPAARQEAIEKMIDKATR